MTIAEALAERIHSVRYDAFPEEALHWARVAILDTVGCSLAGADEPCAHIVARVTAANRPDYAMRHHPARCEPQSHGRQ